MSNDDPKPLQTAWWALGKGVFQNHEINRIPSIQATYTPDSGVQVGSKEAAAAFFEVADREVEGPVQVLSGRGRLLQESSGYVCMHECMYISTYTHICACVYVYTHIYKYMYAYTHIYIHIYVYIDTHMYV